jgi:hypothetical protein
MIIRDSSKGRSKVNGIRPVPIYEANRQTTKNSPKSHPMLLAFQQNNLVEVPSQSGDILPKSVSMRCGGGVADRCAPISISPVGVLRRFALRQSRLHSTMTTHATIRIMKELREFHEHPDNNLYVLRPALRSAMPCLRPAASPETAPRHPLPLNAAPSSALWRLDALSLLITAGPLLRVECDAVQRFAYWPGRYALRIRPV